ncbi:MAG TPA: PepSY-like domain-containing protein [Chitinophagaceae bacterium]|nr:PepSY-like domain-containing protein [Chitinophagaceae bacterium]
MKKTLGIIAILFAVSTASFAQKEKGEKGEKEDNKKISVPVAVKSALSKKYPTATKITWEKENGNYEANWGGKEGEDNSVQFTPSGNFIEVINVIPVSQLPAPVIAYIKAHYKAAKITEAGKVTDAKGKIFYEAEVKKKDLIFDVNGNFIKSE